MAKTLFPLFALCFLYSCVSDRNSNIIEVPYVIVEKDTVFVTVEVQASLAEKYEGALRKYLGLKELTGNNDGPEIERMLLNCGINIPAPYCACYLHNGLLDIGLNGGPGHQPAFTPRWFEDKNRIKYVRDVSNIHMNFEKGWVFGVYFRNLQRIAHVGVILEDFGDGYVLTIEGNTNSAGSREGNGVFIRIRHKSEIYKCADWLTNNS